jgi:hypothetical protein
MEANIQNFIDILTDNRYIVKRYTLESISVDDPRFDNFEFDENLLLSKDEFYIDELLEYIESLSFPLTTAISFELNGFNYQNPLEDYLEHEFEKFRVFYINNFKSIEKSKLKEIIDKVKFSRNELGYLLNVNMRNHYMLNQSLISVKIEFCAETIRFINNPLFIIDNLVDKKKEKSKKSFENLTNMTQNQIVILSHYLREFGYIGKDMPKNLYADYISGLTGFAAEQIRQDFSNIDKKSTSIDSTDFL